MTELGIIHCDLKPENILINKSLPNVKVIDMGSAVRVTNNNPTNKQIYMQSRYYRAPEMLLGKSYDGKIDVWSIGCIAAELFLGHPLFPGMIIIIMFAIVIFFLISLTILHFFYYLTR